MSRAPKRPKIYSANTGWLAHPLGSRFGEEGISLVKNGCEIRYGCVCPWARVYNDIPREGFERRGRERKRMGRDFASFLEKRRTLVIINGLGMRRAQAGVGTTLRKHRLLELGDLLEGFWDDRRVGVGVSVSARSYGGTEEGWATR